MNRYICSNSSYMQLLVSKLHCCPFLNKEKVHTEKQIVNCSEIQCLLTCNPCQCLHMLSLHYCYWCSKACYCYFLILAVGQLVLEQWTGNGIIIVNGLSSDHVCQLNLQLVWNRDTSGSIQRLNTIIIDQNSMPSRIKPERDSDRERELRLEI